jgi:FtsP/CotA-like multicopper oxidase with cupredoxin domain
MFRPSLIFLFFLLTISFTTAFGQTEMCPPRPRQGAIVPDPVRLHSQNGVLSVDFTMLNTLGVDGYLHYCYVYTDGSEAPTLEVNPGDELVLNVTNHLTETGNAMPPMQHMDAASGGGPCAGGTMTSASTNVHFHGLNITPKCHQDEVIKTSIPSGQTFKYTIKIPKNDAPGLYWYHPHPHGFTVDQVLGGAAGALIIDGIEQTQPEVSGLAERVFVVRQFAPIVGSGAKNVIPDDADSSPISINFVPAFQNGTPPLISMKPGEKQLWRFVNATSVYFLALQVKVDLITQNVRVVGLDGIPLKIPATTDTVVIPPAGRAEFVVQGPPDGSFMQLQNLGFDTGPGGDLNPGTVLANIQLATGQDTLPHLPNFSKKIELTRFAGLDQAKAAQTRQLFFSETTIGNETRFFLTVKGQKPRVYDPNEPPAIISQQGSVEDWVLENHTTEVHAFHIHQVHFIVTEINGVPTNDNTLRDTVLVPYWDGVSKMFPSIKVRLDFRNPETAGTFLYHCHILDHEDGGMMAKILVKKAN